MKHLIPILLLACGAAWGQPAVPRIVPQGARTRIVNEEMLPDGKNERNSINGPSLIRVPAWVKNPLGRYYLYFAHHTGIYIRMAYADRLEGPWKMVPGGVLAIKDQRVVSGHIASPDAVIDEARKEIVLFYHGPIRNNGVMEGQHSAAAVSTDGVHFQPLNQVVAPAYLRVFRHGTSWYGLVGNGSLFESQDLHQPFRKVAGIIGSEIVEAMYPQDLAGSRKNAKGAERFSIRHVGVDVKDNRMVVYFSCIGHMPERILATVVDLVGPAASWRARGTIEVLRPSLDWEGVKVALEHSVGGISRQLENSLRDPAVFRENGQAWLLYSAAGEHGLGLVRIEYR